MLIEPSIIVALIGMAAGALSAWLTSRWQKTRMQADAAQIFQAMAIREAEERKKMEAALEERIEQIEQEKTAQDEIIRNLSRELNRLKDEKAQWMRERVQLKDRIQSLELLGTQEKAERTQERQQFERRISDMAAEIRKLQIRTGKLG